MTAIPKLELGPQRTQIEDADIDRFVGFVNQGVEAWVKAGQLLVQMVERNPNTYAVVSRACPNISIDVLLAFERIGRRQIYPYLLLTNAPASQKLLRYPYELQDKYYKEKVKVLVYWLKGKPVIEEKTALSMTKEEAKRVFGETGPRTVEEQAVIFPVPSAEKNGGGKSVSPHSKTRVLGTFKFTLDAKGQPVLKREEDQSLISYHELVLKRDSRGAISSPAFVLKTSEPNPEHLARMNHLAGVIRQKEAEFPKLPVTERPKALEMITQLKTNLTNLEKLH